MAGNLFAGLPVTPEAAERLETLLARPGLRIERIVSTGQSSPPGFWYDQPDAEWVLLMSGDARLRFEDETEARQLRPGDWLHIAPLRRHRVESTAADAPTVWLAVHFPE
ncbi:MAG: cupin [Rhodocyclales bacterium]|nr:cupin [Rhodocyclales bacterium]